MTRKDKEHDLEITSLRLVHSGRICEFETVLDVLSSSVGISNCRLIHKCDFDSARAVVLDDKTNVSVGHIAVRVACGSGRPPIVLTLHHFVPEHDSLAG